MLTGEESQKLLEKERLENHRIAQKKWRDNNKEHIKKQTHEYYINNREERMKISKERYKLSRGQKVKCEECHRELYSFNMPYHKTTNYHKNNTLDS